MPSLTETLQTQCRALTGTAGTFNEDLYAALDQLYTAGGRFQLSELMTLAGGFPSLLYNGLPTP